MSTHPALAGGPRRSRLAARICVSALLLSVGAASAFAQKPTEKSKTSPSPPPATAPAAAPAASSAPSAWSVTCSDRVAGNFTCEMTQSLIDQKSGGQIILLSIKNTSDGAANALLVRFAHGIYLPAGVTLSIDGTAPMPLQFQKSDQLGVYAALPLTDKMIGDMRKGKALTLRTEIKKGEPFELTALLDGFGPALDKVKSVR